MTRSSRRYLASDPERPSVHRASRYFAETVPPRRVRAADGRWREPRDDEHAELIPVCLGASSGDLGSLGIAVQMYFRLLTQLAWATLLCGLVTLPTSLFYDDASEYRSGAPAACLDEVYPFIGGGSAVCCSYAVVNATAGSSGAFAPARYAAPPACKLRAVVGLTDGVATVVLALLLLWFKRSETREIKEADEAVQTAQVSCGCGGPWWRRVAP